MTPIKQLITLLLLVFSVYINAQNSQYFHTRFGGNADEVGNGIVQTLNRGYIVVGQTTSFGALQNDIYLARTDSFAQPKWQKNIGGFLADVGKSVVELPDSSIIIAGYTNSFGAGGYDAYFIKTDKDGNLLWQKTFGGTDWDFAYSINKTADGNLIACGATYSFGRGNKDAFIIKMDVNGNFLWTKYYGGKKEDDLKEIIQTADGGYIATGSTKSYGDTLGDIWITKFNSTGDSTWFKTQGGIKKDVGNSIVQAKNNDYLITGGSESFTYGKEDAYIFRLTNTGTFVWQQFYGLAGEDEESFCVINSGSAYGNIVITYATREQAGYGTDVKTLLLDANGDYVRGGSFGGLNDEVLYSIFNTKDKGYVGCGYTEGYGAVFKDIFIIKYDSEMTIGPLIISVKNFYANRKFNLYPTLILEDEFYIQTNNSEIFSVEIIDVYGRIVEPIKIEKKENNLILCKIPNSIKGLIFINLNKGLVIKKCIVN